MANETRAHIALMTGDLISRYGDPLDACIRQIARLRADAGVFGCMGNHEVYAGVEDYTATESARRGVRFLRQEAVPLHFGNATLNLAGVDYQRLGGLYLVGTERLMAPGSLNVLLSHNPDVFPVAAEQGWDLTIGGHTHGGQISLEILHHNISPARYFTPYVRGLYRIGGAAGYVSTGIGTVGLPVRLGAPPEVSLIRLCAT
jgi:predicted MPP superfamily phosphohydrolase